MSWNKINEFCKVQAAPATNNGVDKIPARVEFLMDLLDSMSIKYELDEFEVKDRPSFWNKNPETNKLYNLVLRGSSSKMIVAHHDIVNPISDNANDNSASVINAIMTKKLRPNVNVVLVDGEEAPFLGAGSTHCAERIKNGDFGNIDYVLNLELTGRGGDNFFIGKVRNPSKLRDGILEIFKCPEISVPFNDSLSFIRAGIDSININPIPITDKKTSVMYRGEYLDIEMLYNCHSMRDSLATISVDDMKIFTEQVICRIIDEV